MSNDIFRFKQFTIHHDRCAMKVGTDGVLLGAWGCVEGHRILDIGTGTGLIALMAAQRNPEAMVTGIDIDQSAILQAQENVATSPFSSRVECLVQDVMTFRPNKCFDAILSNPPFFTEDTMPTDKSRALARSNQSLPFPQLIKKVATLMADTGTFSLIVPSGHGQEIIGLCLENNLHLIRRCQISTTSRKSPRRTMLTFARKEAECEEHMLCLIAQDGERSQEYRDLTKDFYL